VEPVFSPVDEELELLPGELSATPAEGVITRIRSRTVRIE
jgi:hypothetical protein